MAWDSWAFIEVAFDGARRSDVEELLAGADFTFTVRDVVAETFGFIVKETGESEIAWRWLQSLEKSRVRVYEPPLRDVREFIEHQPRRGALSFTDYALAFTAIQDGVVEIASEDSGFRGLGLTPVFSRR